MKKATALHLKIGDMYRYLFKKKFENVSNKKNVDVYISIDRTPAAQCSEYSLNPVTRFAKWYKDPKRYANKYFSYFSFSMLHKLNTLEGFVFRGACS